MATDAEVVEAGSVNGLTFKPPIKNDHLSTDGTGDSVCKLDVRTKLRMVEAENAVLQQQISLVLAEKSAVEEASTTFYTNWQFSLMQCGRIAEEKGEITAKLDVLKPPTVSTTGKKARKGEIEQLKVALDTQNRVCEQLEQERDRANDDFQSCQAQLVTLLDNYHILATASAAVARERDAAQQEVLVLRQQLAQWSESQEKNKEGTAPKHKDNSELQKELTQCKEKLKKSEHSRSQAVKDKQATDSIVTLWQRKHEKVVNENRELKDEVLVAQERISFLQEQLAVLRLHQRTGQEETTKSNTSTNTSQIPNSNEEEVSWI